MKTIKTTAIAALLSCSLMTPAPVFAAYETDVSGATTFAMEAKCDAIALNHGPASVWSAELVTSSVAGTATGPTLDVGLPTINAGSQVGVGTPELSALLATGTVGHKNGGSQNIFTTGTATKTYSSYTFNGVVSTTTPVSYGFTCALTEIVQVPTTVPGTPEVENKGQCVSRIQTAGSTRSDAEEYCDDLSHRQMVPGADTIIYTPTPTPRGVEAGAPVSQDVVGSRSITDALSSAYPLLPQTLELSNQAVDNVLACISPDNLMTWVGGKNGATLNCVTEASLLGLTPISGKKR